jgi:hypothetical protein
MSVVLMVRLLALGLLPAVGFGIWEMSLRRAERRSGVATPVSAEGLRWLLYGAGVYELCYGGLAVAWLDGGEGSRPPLLIAAVICVMLATGVLLWDLGSRYAPRIPRLGDMRRECYRARLQLTARVRLLRWHGYRNGGLDDEIAEFDGLVSDSGRQLHRLQHALTTEVFLRRVRRDELARREADEILDAQHRLLRDAQRCLLATALLAPRELCFDPVRIA